MLEYGPNFQPSTKQLSTIITLRGHSKMTLRNDSNILVLKITPKKKLCTSLTSKTGTLLLAHRSAKVDRDKALKQDLRY
jgi:hypothetical protein